MSSLRELERSFAYQYASSVIESECVPKEDGERVWFDLATADGDISGEADYLEARGLLERNPEQPSCVSVCDEDEPVGVVAEEFSAEGATQLDRIEAGQKLILEEIHKMADSQAQLDTELTTVETDLAALGTELTTAITDLEAKAAGSGIDFTPEVTRLSTIAATLTSLTAAAAAADPGAPAAAAVAEAKPVETPAA